MPIGKKQIALPITCFWGRVSNGFYFESFVCCIKKAQAGSPGFLVIKERFNVFLTSRRLPAFLRCSLPALRCCLLALRCCLLALRCSLLALRCGLLLDLPLYYLFLHYPFLNNPLLRGCLLPRYFLSCSHTKPPTSLAQSEYKQVITNYQFYFMENCTCHASVLAACAQLYLCLNIAANTQHQTHDTKHTTPEREHCAFHFLFRCFLC